MPFIALVSMASMVGLLGFRPAPVADLVARMPSGFAEAARGKAKPLGARVFEHRTWETTRKVFAALATAGVLDESAKVQGAAQGVCRFAQEAWKRARGMEHNELKGRRGSIDGLGATQPAWLDCRNGASASSACKLGASGAPIR
ncbi:hypothetical protein K100096D8_12800 [Eggerthella lenta]